MTKKLIVGIDEVGRGPLAGPVSIGVVVLPAEFDTTVFGKFGDSKKMTEKARERVHALAGEARASGHISFGVYSQPAEVIDSRGILFALNQCIQQGLTELVVDPATCVVYLDGSLRAPAQYAQESMIRGDSLVPAISLASIVAKVERDRYMSTVAEAAHPEYGFKTHKGYGTASHIAALRTHGPSPLHRSSFIRNIMIQSQHE